MSSEVIAAPLISAFLSLKNNSNFNEKLTTMDLPGSFKKHLNYKVN